MVFSPETIEIRPACPEDGAAICKVYRAAWPEEEIQEEQVVSTLQDSSHAASVALRGKEMVGFVDGFRTVSRTGRYRWEVDLLAVIPSARNRQVAGRLVETNLRQVLKMYPKDCAAQETGAPLYFTRALIHIDNTASKRVFARCGFSNSIAELHLFTTRRPLLNPNIAACRSRFPSEAWLVGVQTFTYGGWWLEQGIAQGFTPAMLQSARAALVERPGLLGVLIAAEDLSSRQAAIEAGYSFVGAYTWWQRSF